MRGSGSDLQLPPFVVLDRAVMLNSRLPTTLISADAKVWEPMSLVSSITVAFEPAALPLEALAGDDVVEGDASAGAIPDCHSICTFGVELKSCKLKVMGTAEVCSVHVRCAMSAKSGLGPPTTSQYWRSGSEH